MKNEITLKKYDIDYSFIVRNYLSPELWTKTWTLFVYKNISVNLCLSSIDVQQPITITFEISLTAPGFNRSTYKYHTLNQSNLKILTNQIDNAIIYLIEQYENYIIKDTEEYNLICEACDKEKDNLRSIVEDYLDDNDITIAEIRDSYIDYYINNNACGNTYKYNYISSLEYKKCSDLWLIYAKMTNNNVLYDKIERKLSNDCADELEKIKEYVDMMCDEYSDEYSDYFSDKKDCLESL